MTPEYIEELANQVDSGQLWRLAPFEQMSLPAHLRRQLDAGVALRRHAADLRHLRSLLGSGKSLLITAISESGTATMTVPTPPEHARLLRLHQQPNPGLDLL